MKPGTLDILRYIIVSLETLAAIIGLLYWKKWKGTPYAYFILYLVTIAVAEYFGFYFSKSGMKVANWALFNYIIIPFEFLFFFWLFQAELKKKKLALWFVVIYLVSWLIDIFFLAQPAYKSRFWFSSFSYTVGNILLLVFLLLFLIQLVTGDSILYFKNNILFWISLGLLLFYLGTFPYFGLRNLLSLKYKPVYYLYTYLFYALNYLMYLSFIGGLIWGRPRLPSS